MIMPAPAGSVGTVDTQFLDLPEPLALDCGRVLHPIRVAYETYRDAAQMATPSKSGRQMSAAVRASMDRIHRLQQENAELRKREMLLLEQFHRWAYHASARGLTLEFLDRPLPPLNRRGNRASPRKVALVEST